MRNIALAVALFIAILIISFSSWQSGFGQGRDKGYAEGVEAGKGQLAEAMIGHTYELKLVGMKDGKAYEVESSCGYSINNQPVIQSIPASAKIGDSVVCINPQEGIQVLSPR